MKNIFSILILSSLVLGSAMASSSDFPYELAGLNWSHDLGSNNQQAAISACEKIGGRLPSQDDYIQLLKSLPYVYSDINGNPQLSYDGFQRLQEVFSDQSIRNKTYWTSSNFEYMGHKMGIGFLIASGSARVKDVKSVSGESNTYSLGDVSSGTFVEDTSENIRCIQN